MTKSKHPTQGDAPVIDRQAEEADVVMPTAENEPPCIFQPGAGVTTTDVLEIALMYLLQLSGSPAQVQPGALRTQVLEAARVGQLSPEARRWMKPVTPAPVAQS